MRTFKVAAFAALLVHASATGAVAAQDDPATNFADPATNFAGVGDRQPDVPRVEPRVDEFWFDNGFATLHDQIGSIMGRPLGPERQGDDGDVIQRTSTGLAVWKPGQAPRFTDGWRVWTTESPGEQRTATVAAAAPGVPYGIWDRLAGCESGGNWASVSNPKYKGGVQMDATFWARYGGLAYASAPQYASREAQITVAQRGLAAQGWGAWPTCSRILGLR